MKEVRKWAVKRLILAGQEALGTLAIAVDGLVGAALLNLVTPEMVRRLTSALESDRGFSRILIPGMW